MGRISVIEDGGSVPTDEIVVRGSKDYWRNPRISEEQLRRSIDRNRPAANSPDAANDPNYLEEVEVRERRLPDINLRQIMALLRRSPWGRLGALGDQTLPRWVQEAIKEAEKEATEDVMAENDLVQDALLDPAPSPVLPEVKIFGKVTPKPQVSPGALFDFAKRWHGDPWASPSAEEITVYGKRTRTGAHVQVINFPWELISILPVHPPRPVNDPDYLPFPESLPEPKPAPAPKKPPKTEPDAEPSPDNLPGKAPFMEGVITFQINPNTGIRVSIKRNPARNREENKLRRDRKDETAAKAYRRILYVVNTTYGSLDELQELWQALAQNIEINGTPLYNLSNPAERLWAGMKHGTIDVDFIGMVQDLAYNQMQDKMFGKLGQMSGEAQQGLGLHPGQVPLAKQGMKPGKKRRKRKSWNDYYHGP